MLQIHEGLSTQEASDVIQALKSQGPRTRSHMSTSFAQMKLEDNLLVDRVSLACSGADVHVFKNGRSGLQLLGSSGFSMSMAISKLPPPTVSDIPLVRVVLSLPPLKAGAGIAAQVQEPRCFCT